VVWVRDGDFGESELSPIIHRSVDGAKAWCNENRKLGGGTGDPIRWFEYRNQNAWDGTATIHYRKEGKSFTARRLYDLRMCYLEN